MPAVERSETQHEFLEFEWLGEVVVGTESESGGLVVEPVGSGEHEDWHAAAGGDDASGDLVTGRAGDVAIEDGDVVGVDAQQFQRGAAVSGDVGRDRLEAQTVADRFGHHGLVLDDQHAHAVRCCQSGHIVGVSRNAYVLATRRRLHWGRGLQPTSTNSNPLEPADRVPGGAAGVAGAGLVDSSTQTTGRPTIAAPGVAASGQDGHPQLLAPAPRARTEVNAK